MRNVTITLEDDVARWAKVWAAEHDTSVSRMIAELLLERMRDVSESEYAEARRDWGSRGPWHLSGGKAYPSRKEIHDRHHAR